MKKLIIVLVLISLIVVSAKSQSDSTKNNNGTLGLKPFRNNTLNLQHHLLPLIRDPKSRIFISPKTLDSLDYPLKNGFMVPKQEKIIVPPFNLIRDPKDKIYISPNTPNFVDRHPADKMPVLVPGGNYSLRVYKPDTIVRYTLRVIR
jgi:hypothetical protein